jgi:glycerophosphoryl diester phosphodiesterase
MIEVDVRISGDGILVAHHDPEIGDLKISEATVEELRRVGIEDLEYIVGALGDEALYMIDIKIPDVIGELRRIILKYGLQERAILAGDPVAVKALGDELNILMAPSFGLCNWGYSLKRTLEMGAQILNENKVCYDPEAHREALNHGLLISVWTVNDPHEIEDFALRGMHFLVTDNIEEAVKIVRRLRELTKHDLGWYINA